MKYDTDFKHLIPKLSHEEHALLAKNIKRDGCRDPVVVWTETLSSGEPGRTMILDGHNRYQICKQYKIEFTVMELKLKDMNEAKIWVIQNQLGRRNLTDYQRGKLSLELKSMIQEKAKRKQIEGGKEKVPQKSAKPPIDTREELAKIAGVSHDTIHKVEVIEKEAGPEVKEAVEKGEISINKAYKETRPPRREPLYPVTEFPETSALKDGQSRNLALLKDAWLRANKSDRKRFLQWLQKRKEGHALT
jgi:ParB-like chromosome segregation protein Spo0J